MNLICKEEIDENSPLFCNIHLICKEMNYAGLSSYAKRRNNLTVSRAVSRAGRVAGNNSVNDDFKNSKNRF